MNFEYAATLDEAIQLAYKSMPKADVTILPPAEPSFQSSVVSR